VEDEFGLDGVDDDVQSYWWCVVRYESKLFEPKNLFASERKGVGD